MGQAKQRRARFLEAHPWCCFCGGRVASDTIDHVPNRACFHGRNGPDGFEFPACQKCQNALRQEEQFFAFMCHLSDRDKRNDDSESSKKLIRGVVNNLPDLVPRIVRSSIERRKGLHHLGIERPTGLPLSEFPMVELPVGVDPVIRKATIKIGLALYYRHKSVAAPSTHMAAAFWAQYSDKNSMSRFAQVTRDLPNFQQGKRRNLEFGNRFSYAWNVQDDGEPDIFFAVSKFGNGLMICNILAEDRVFLDEEPDSSWISVGDFSSATYPPAWEAMGAGWVGSQFQS